MNVKHGQTRNGKRTREFNAYESARRRCEWPRCKSWKNYGGRGIEFRFESFDQFLREVGPHPGPGYSLDRKENNGHYEPGNIRWATVEEQSKNQRHHGPSREKIVNTACFAGRVGQDAELKYTQSGKAVASFSIAINQGKDSDGEEKAPLWIKATIWEKRAEALAPHIKKGSFAIVSGPVNVEVWANKNDGAAQGRIVVTVREFTFGGSKNDGGSSNSAPASKPQTPPSSGSGPITDDDIPF